MCKSTIDSNIYDYSCDMCQNPAFKILKFKTNDNLYYYNISNSHNPMFLGRFEFSDSYNWYSPHNNPESLQTNMTTSYFNSQNMSVIDSFSNGTFYTVVGNWSKNAIKSLELINWDVKFD